MTIATVCIIKSEIARTFILLRDQNLFISYNIRVVNEKKRENEMMAMMIIKLISISFSVLYEEKNKIYQSIGLEKDTIHQLRPQNGMELFINIIYIFQLKTIREIFFSLCCILIESSIDN